MHLGNVTLVTQPDRFFNLDSSYLLVNPSAEVIKQFQTIISDVHENLTVFIYDTSTSDLEWLLGVSCQSDMLILDIDNCTAETRPFITFLLTHPHAYYITTDEITPYHLISKNRIFDLDQINEDFGLLDQFNDEDDYE